MAGSSGHYVLREISSGGMGRVELILRREGEFERLYALKRLLPEVLTDPNARGMFLDEARIAGLLRHPHVVSVHDVGEDEHGPFLVMDFVEGVSAQSLIRWARDRDELLPTMVVLDIAIAAAEGLDAAHELCDANGNRLALVHRDVSPQNILLGFDGTVRLTDFGIAKILGQSTKTSTGILKGKLGYMSPEQLRFDPVDQRSDLFSLGVVVYELLTGRRLYYDADSTLTARRILREPPPDLGQEREDVHPELVGLLFELLAKEPAHRPATAREVANRLSAIASQVRLFEEESPTLREFMARELAPERALRRSEIDEAKALLERGGIAPMAWPRGGSDAPKRRRRGIALVAAAVVVAALALGLVASRLGDEERSDEPRATPPPPAAAASEADEPAPSEREPVDRDREEALAAPPERPTEARARHAPRRRPRAGAMSGEMAVAPVEARSEVVSFGGLPIAPPTPGAGTSERAGP